MAYESPISVWWSDAKIEQLRDEYNNLIIRAVKNVYPQVDEDELIKALEYDRGQYEKGFADGRAFKPPVESHGDGIRAMTDEELAEFIGGDPMHDICPNNCHEDLDRPCKVCVLRWLRQPKEKQNDSNNDI